MPTPAPRTTPSPIATPAPDFIDTPRGVFHNTPSMTIYPSGPDYAGTTGDDVFSGNFEGENYQSLPAAPTLRLEPSFLFGNPTVETPTTSAPFQSAGILDNEPSIFGDDWIRNSAEVAASFDSSNSGGSIWSDDNTSLQDFGGDTRLGRDLSADLGSLRFGEDYPAGEQVNPESPFDPRAEPTGIPIEPNMLPQDVDNEWTTSPDDRRFLPEPSPSPEPAGPARTVSGVDIRTFGGQSFGNNISLGAYLNTPLSLMRFGENYPSVSGGDVITPGSVEHTPGSDEWRDNAAGGPGVNDGTGTSNLNREGSAAFNTARLRSLGQLSRGGWPTPEGMTIIGYDTQSAAPIYQDAQGNRFVNPGTGTPVRAQGGQHWDYTQSRMVDNNNATGAQFSDSSNRNFTGGAASAMQMWYQSMSGNVNQTDRIPEEGQNKFWNGLWRMEEGGGFSQVGERRPGVRLPSGVLSTVDLNTVRRYNAANSGVRGVPATSTGGRGG